MASALARACAFSAIATEFSGNPAFLKHHCCTTAEAGPSPSSSSPFPSSSSSSSSPSSSPSSSSSFSSAGGGGGGGGGAAAASASSASSAPGFPYLRAGSLDLKSSASPSSPPLSISSSSSSSSASAAISRSASSLGRRSSDVRAYASASSSAQEVELESEAGVSYQELQKLLSTGQWEKADEETRRLIIVLAGENAVKRKYVFFSEVQFMPKADLATIDRLWRAYSDGKFGYSVQRKIMKRVGGDCTEFFKKVGWMKPLGDEYKDSQQFTYRSFPSEFMWDMEASTPVGHLPLTNALRGSQLLRALLLHPAFDFADDELIAPSSSSAPPPPPDKQKKPLTVNYSF